MNSFRSAIDAWADNPVLRRELRRQFSRRSQRAAIAILWAIFALGFAAGVYYRRDAGEAAMVILLIVCVATALLGALSAGSTCIVGERERQTWEALVTTRLAAHEIVVGKAAAVLAGALVPVLPALPLIVVLSLLTKRVVPTAMAPLPTALALLYLPFAAAAYGSLAVAVSATRRRTSEASGVTLLIAFLSIVYLLRAFFLPFEYGEHLSRLVLPMGLLFGLTTALAAVLLAWASRAVAPSRHGYLPGTRIAGAAFYAALLMLSVQGTRYFSERSILALFGAHAAVWGVAAAVICARSSPWGRDEDRPAPVSFVAADCRGALLYAVAVHVLAVAAVAVATIGSGPNTDEYMLWNGPGPELPTNALLWVAILGTGHVLFSAAYGSLVASRLPRLSSAGRAAIAAMLPLAITIAASTLYSESGSPWSHIIGGGSGGVVGWLYVALYLVVGNTELILRAAGAGPFGRDGLIAENVRLPMLGAQVAASAGFLWLATRGPSAGKRSGAAG